MGSILRSPLRPLVLAVVTVLAIVTPVYANNTHVVNRVGHGLGDGQDSDYYVHAYTDTGYGYSRKSTTLYSDPCYYTCDFVSSSSARHVHISWDTNPYGECLHASNHANGSPTDLNLHNHYHHYYCG